MDERAALIERLCAGDGELRAEVERMLASDSAAGDFLEPPTSFALPEALGEGVFQSLIGQNMGGFELIRLVAVGGMGAVYEAEQSDPRRRVAVKVMNLSGSRSMYRRFRYEIETLASLHHPNIAQVFEAGVHTFELSERRISVPYFAMEYVEGATDFISFARSSELSTRARLELFLEVCSAVQSGHQRGIVHRDLKPANILVDSDGRPKVIDFGIARATELGTEGERTVTRTGEVLGTLGYMSPEQIAGRPEVVDTRSDVYSLGVVLYELLCERRPFELSGLSLHEVARVLSEEPPLRPSLARPGLDDDLEWILLKALEKEPERRYSSASELAADIDRSLRHEPVTAGPPTAAYRLRKFSRRNRGALVAAGLLLIALTVGAIGTWQGAVEARVESERALIEVRRVRRINELLEKIMTSSAPWIDGHDVRVVQVLDRARIELTEALQDEPDILASLKGSLGRAYLGLGIYDHATPLLSAASEAERERLGPDDQTVLELQLRLASSKVRAGDLDAAEAVLAGHLERCEAEFGAENPLTRHSRSGLAELYRYQARLHDAAALLERNLESTPVDRADALDAHRDAAALGAVYLGLGRFEEAEAELQEALEGCLRTLGPDAYATMIVQLELSSVSTELGYFAPALELLEDFLSRAQGMLGEDDTRWLTVLARKANCQYGLSRFAEAEALYRELIEKYERGPERHTQDALELRVNLAETLKRQHRDAEAAEILTACLGDARAMFDDGHPAILNCWNNLASVLRKLRRYDEAIVAYEGVIEASIAAKGIEHADTIASMNGLGRTLLQSGNVEDALTVLTEVVDLAREHLPPDHWWTGGFLGTYGEALFTAGRHEEAEAAVLEGYERLLKNLGPGHSLITVQIDRIADMYEFRGMPDEARFWRRKLAAADDPN